MLYKIYRQILSEVLMDIISLESTSNDKLIELAIANVVGMADVLEEDIYKEYPGVKDIDLTELFGFFISSIYEHKDRSAEDLKGMCMAAANSIHLYLLQMNSILK